MSKIEVDVIDKQSGSTLTLGGSGTAVTLACGATQSGFGRSGSVNWQTTPKTTTFTAANGEGYFINQGSQITANLPAGSAGAIVAFADYARNFATYNFIVSPNGSEKIGGVAQNLVLSVDGQALTLIYVDSTKGWVNVQNAEDTETGLTPAYVTATGGTPTTCGDFKIHTFTGPGTFCVSCAGNPLGNDQIEYTVVAGGGGGGGKFCTSSGGAGGGAGGFRFASPSLSPATYPAKPLAAPSGLTASATAFPITVGGGGAGGALCRPGCNGTNSVFSTIISTGGGGGSGGGQYPGGGTGGSGGGTSLGNPTTPCGTALAGNTPPVSPPQGFPGGAAIAPGNHASGGGGATVAGSQVGPTGGPGGAGGGLPTAFGSNGESCGSYRYYAGGGGGGGYNCGCNGQGGVGGGGNANTGGPATSHNATVNTGGGAGGVGAPGVSQIGGVGGSGIVIIRYKFQN